MATPQANGYYPRLNAAMIATGNYNGSIVSLMGRFVSGAGGNGGVSFQCSDGGTLSLSVEHAEIPNMDVQDGPVVEVVGQVMKENEVAVRAFCVVCVVIYCIRKEGKGIQLPRVPWLHSITGSLDSSSSSSSFVYIYSSLSRENFPRTRISKYTTR
jgi:hypothetical protein